MRKKLKNRIFQGMCFLGFLTIFFSCQGISLSKIVHADMTQTDHSQINCCETGQGMHITSTQVESLFVFPVLKPPFNLFLFVSITFIVFLFSFSEYFRDRGKGYIRSIRDKYGSFLPLNFLNRLFAQGLLHSKVF